jgi:hypothetical protein
VARSITDVYYLDSTGLRKQEIRWPDFASSRSRVVSPVEGEMGVAFSVSPDRRTVLFTRLASPGKRRRSRSHIERNFSAHPQHVAAAAARRAIGNSPNGLPDVAASINPSEASRCRHIGKFFSCTNSSNAPVREASRTIHRLSGDDSWNADDEYFNDKNVSGD